MRRGGVLAMLVLVLLLARGADAVETPLRRPLVDDTGVAIDPVRVATLATPLITRVAARPALPHALAWRISASIRVPPEAPPDLGVGAYVADHQGRWFQVVAPAVLHPGSQTITLVIGGDAPPPAAEPPGTIWDASHAALMQSWGLIVWSATRTAAPCTLLLTDLRAEALRPDVPAATPALEGLAQEGVGADGDAHVVTGERWQVHCAPTPLPGNPYDPSRFTLDARITFPDGTVRAVPGFFEEPQRLVDGGDREIATAQAAGRFTVRFRPVVPGRYHIALQAHWVTAAVERRVALPDLVAEGPAHDPIVHIDPADPRFFSIDGQFCWPIGLNCHNLVDLRSADRLETELTPARLSQGYVPLLARCAAAGISAVEIWMASWNCGLEWRADWPPYEGLTRFSQAHAAALDRILDAAAADGVRVNLVIWNHGQASPRMDSEWNNSPYNVLRGGPLQDPSGLFSDPRALAAQAALRRYLIARYADHPAILGWKLWSEINLTADGAMGQRMGGFAAPPAAGAVGDRHHDLVTWHAATAAAWHREDIYGHGVSTHWSSDYRVAEDDIMRLPGIDYICIDAYLQRRGQTILPDLLFDSLHDPTAGLDRAHKGVLVTEYGGSPQAATPDELAAELSCAPWEAFVSGMAGGPMLWWSEWVDQENRWASFGAVARFIRGEDLRGADAHAQVLATSNPTHLLATAWVRPGRILAYVVDRDWAEQPSAPGFHAGELLTVGRAIAPGACTVSVWDCDRGVVTASWSLVHPGGPLVLSLPPFLHHVALKIIRPGG